jgi:hypothetical protein
MHARMRRMHTIACMQVRWETNLKNGVCGVSFDRPDIKMNKFVACCLESQMHVFDARTQHPKKVSDCEPTLRRLLVSQPPCNPTPLVAPYTRILPPIHAPRQPNRTKPHQNRAKSTAKRNPKGFASLAERLSSGSTVWGAAHLPQDRDLFAAHAGDGGVGLYRYCYPDQRKVKVRGGGGVESELCWSAARAG